MTELALIREAVQRSVRQARGEGTPVAAALPELGLVGPEGAPWPLVVAALEEVAAEDAGAATIALTDHLGRALAGRPIESEFVATAVLRHPCAGVLPSCVLAAGAPGSWVVEGAVRTVANASLAGATVFLAQGSAPGGGLFACAVPLGVRVTSCAVPLLGLRRCAFGDVQVRGLTLEAARVRAIEPAEVDRVVDEHAAAVAAILAGILRRGSAVGWEYARERTQGGTSICEHAAVRSMLDAVDGAHEAAHAAVHALLEPASARPSALLGHVKRAAGQVAADVVQVFGGYGYMEDHPAAEVFRDLHCARHLLG